MGRTPGMRGKRICKRSNEPPKLICSTLPSPIVGQFNAWVDAATEWGLTPNDDFNGARQIGAGAYQVNCHNGRRWSGADAYLRPAMQRPNLVVRVGAHVTRVLIDGSRATGVSFVQHRTETVAHAASEVLLSGGVINSPQLLLLSGMGPADQVRRPARDGEPGENGAMAGRPRRPLCLQRR